MNNPIELVVTRHPALVAYLRELGMVSDDVVTIEHVSDPIQLSGRVVAGVLPIHLAAECAEVVEVPLTIPADLRGVELSLDQVRQYAKPARRFFVREAEDQASLVATLVDAVVREMARTYEGAVNPCPEDYAAELAHDKAQAILALGGKP